MISIHIWLLILICVIIFVLGFMISGFLSGSKIEELDNENMNLRVKNNRKDTIIDFYKSHNIGMNKETIPEKIKSNKNNKT